MSNIPGVSKETRAELEAICKRHGYTLDDVRKKGRAAGPYYARVECYAHLVSKGFTTTRIGRAFNRDHSGVCLALNQGTRAVKAERRRKAYYDAKGASQ